METISIWAIAKQKSCFQLYVCLDLKYKEYCQRISNNVTKWPIFKM